MDADDPNYGIIDGFPDAVVPENNFDVVEDAIMGEDQLSIVLNPLENGFDETSNDFNPTLSTDSQEITLQPPVHIEPTHLEPMEEEPEPEEPIDPIESLRKSLLNGEWNEDIKNGVIALDLQSHPEFHLHEILGSKFLNENLNQVILMKLSEIPLGDLNYFLNLFESKDSKTLDLLLNLCMKLRVESYDVIRSHFRFNSVIPSVIRRTTNVNLLTKLFEFLRKISETILENQLESPEMLFDTNTNLWVAVIHKIFTPPFIKMAEDPKIFRLHFYTLSLLASCAMFAHLLKPSKIGILRKQCFDFTSVHAFLPKVLGSFLGCRFVEPNTDLFVMVALVSFVVRFLELDDPGLLEYFMKMESMGGFGEQVGNVLRGIIDDMISKCKGNDLKLRPLNLTSIEI